MSDGPARPGPTGPDTPDPTPQGLRLLDLAGVVVGYGVAALALRTLWPAGVTPSVPVLAVVALVYAWLGLAMSGPFVLLRRPGPPEMDRDPSGRPRRARVGQPLEIRPEPPPRYTRAEAAWLLIGGYWIAAAVLVLPTRLPARSAPILGLIPILAAAALWALGPRRAASHPMAPSWTHRAAVLLLLTWPPAWLALILLAATFG